MTSHPPQRRGTLLRTIRAALVAGLVSAGAGCGGGADRRPASLPNADEVLRQARVAADALTAFQLGVDVSIQARFLPGSVSKLVSDAVAEPLLLQGQGPVDGRAASIDLDATIAGLPGLQANVTKVGDGVYLDLLGSAYRVDLPRGQVAAIVPADLPSGLIGWATSPRTVGLDDLDGVQTVHLTTSVLPARVVDDLTPTVSALLGTPLTPVQRRAVAAGLTTTTMDVWVGVDDMRPRRLSATVRYTGGPRVPSVESLTLELDLKFSFPERVGPIAAPAESEPLQLDRLTALARD